MDKEELQRKIGLQIVKLRNARGMTQADLARACFKDRQAIERIENGKANPTLFTLHELANALKVTLKELLDFE